MNIFIDNLPLKTIADVAPMTPKKALYAGHLSVTGSDIV